MRRAIAGQRRLVVAGGVGLAALALVVVIGAVTGGGGSSSEAASNSTATTTIKRQDLVETGSSDGTLGYGDSREVVNRLTGTVTWLPEAGTVIRPDHSLYRVDGSEVVLMNGTVPAYRALSSGVSSGADVEQLERNLRALGYDGAKAMTLDGTWDSATTAAVARWQDAHGFDQTGTIELGRIVFQPGARRVAKLDVTLGGSGSSSGGSGSGASSGSTDGASTSATTSSTELASASAGAARVSFASYSPTADAAQATTPTTTTPAPTAQQLAAEREAAKEEARRLAAQLRAARRRAAKQKAAQKKSSRQQAAGPSPAGGAGGRGSDGSSAGAASAGGSSGSSAGASSGSSAGGSTASAIMTTTSTKPVVAVKLDTSKAALARTGSAVTVELPSGDTAGGRVQSVGKVATSDTSSSDSSTSNGGSGSSSDSTAATVEVTVRLSKRTKALDQAPVTVNFEQSRRRNVLAVPVTALLARAGGKFALEVRDGGGRRLVAVEPGLYAGGNVEISGRGLRPGMRVTDARV